MPWIQVGTGKYEFKPGTTQEELMAKYVILGSDLKELDAWMTDPWGKYLLSQIIKSYNEIMVEGELWKKN